MLAAVLAASLFVTSLYEQVALRTLPVERPDELFVVRTVGVAASGRSGGSTWFHHSDFVELARSAAPDLPLAAYGSESGVLTLGDRSERIETAWVSPDLFALLGVEPAIGNLFSPGLAHDVDAGQAVLSHGAWSRRFGGDREVVGRTVRVDGAALTIVGVTPRGFRGFEVGAAPEIYRLAAGRSAGWGIFGVIGRRDAATPLAVSEARLRSLYGEILARTPDQRFFVMIDGEMTEAERRIELEPGARGFGGSSDRLARMLEMVATMVAIVLAILCANLANLLAVRAGGERRQAAVRLALGATRLQIARPWLVDSLLIALSSGLLGALLTWAAAPAMLRAMPAAQLELAFELRPDAFAFAALATLILVTGLAVGALAAWESRRVDASERLRSDGPTSTASRSRARLRWGLVAGQVALGCLLLVGMGLLVRSLDRLLELETGYPIDRILTFRLDQIDAEPDRIRSTLVRIERELEGLPGVGAVAVSPATVLSGGRSFSTYSIEGYEPAEGESMMIDQVPASAGWFAAVGLRAARGRLPERDPAPGALRPAVVNRIFAQRYFGDHDPIGRRLSKRTGRLAWGEADPDDLVIVAVIDDGVIGHVRESPAPRVYPSFDRDQAPATFYLRTDLPAASLAATVRSRVAAVAPAALSYDFWTLEQRRDALLVRERFLRDVALGFGLFAVLLAATGLYSVLAYVMQSRRRELALRCALGARPRDLVRISASGGLVPVAFGLAVGLALTLPAARLLRSHLYGVEAHDPIAVGGAALLLIGAAVVAAVPPALAAARTDPAAALRAETE